MATSLVRPREGDIGDVSMAKRQKRGVVSAEEEYMMGRSLAHLVNRDFFFTLITTKVEDVCPSLTATNMVTVTRDESLPSVLQKLTERNLLSAPVLKTDEGKWVGFIDMLDLVNYCVEKFDESMLSTSWLESFSRQEAFQQTAVSDIFPISRRMAFFPTFPGFSLYSAIEVLSRNAVHRIPIIERGPSFKILTVLTQSTVAAWLLANIGNMGSIADSQVQMLFPEQKEVIKINSGKRAIEAFRMMSEYNISGLPVVSDDGKLVGNISVSDLKRIAADASRALALFQPLTVWVQQPPIFCRPTDTYQFALSLMCTNRVHRIFVCNDNVEPIAVLSLRDMISAILP